MPDFFDNQLKPVLNDPKEKPLPRPHIPCRLFKVALDLQSGVPAASSFAGAIRNRFGPLFKSIVCIQPGTRCRRCMLKNSCIYPFLFETPLPPDAAGLKKYRDIPRPFSFRPRGRDGIETMELLLIGKAVEMLPFFIYTLNELGKKGLGKQKTTFTVATVRLEGNEPVYRAQQPDECGRVLPRILEVAPGDPLYGSAVLNFKTPLVIRKKAAIVSSFESYPFFTALLRRIVDVNAFYGVDPACAVDEQPWLDAAKSIVYETETDTPEQHDPQTAKAGSPGITGIAKLTGDIGTLMPLIKAGEVLGVGKKTAFGYGEYEVGKE